MSHDHVGEKLCEINLRSSTIGVSLRKCFLTLFPRTLTSNKMKNREELDLLHYTEVCFKHSEDIIMAKCNIISHKLVLHVKHEACALMKKKSIDKLISEVMRVSVC